MILSEAEKALAGIIEPKAFEPDEYYKREYLKYHGFEGFISVRDLKDKKIKEVPTRPGLFVLLRENDTDPDFLDKNPADNGKKIYTFDKEILKKRWVKGQHLIYVSAAKRLRDKIEGYVRFEKGWNYERKLAGRIVWQIKDYDDFVVAWREEESKDDYLLAINLANFANKFRFFNEEGKHIYGFVDEK